MATPEERERARERSADGFATRESCVMTKAELTSFTPQPKCGSYAKWQRGCRCRPCCDAKNAANREQKRRSRERAAS